jgi:hypothetical protein
MAASLTRDEQTESERRVRSLKIRAEEARVLAKTQQLPPDGSTHWSTRRLGRVLKIHHNLVAKTASTVH